MTTRNLQGPSSEPIWRLTGDLDRFLADSESFLHSRPALHTLVLTLTDTVRTCGPYAFGPEAPVLGLMERAGEVCAALFFARPHRLNLTSLTTQEADVLAAHLAGLGHRIPGVYADQDTATAFAAAWRQHTGAAPRLHERQCLYRLDAFAPPQLPPGRARVAEQRDHEDVARLYRNFAASIGEPPTRDPAEWAATRISFGGITLWENPDGVPVAMAGTNPMVAGQIRISIVYTLEHLRGRGYGGALIGEVTRGALASGPRDVLLFTNLANPTSNALVQRIGYRPVATFALYDFAPAASGAPSANSLT
ncbi:GNAT family N-acetyltransferase [Streptomyces sp. SID8381]|uniref:GNAT family N-acetyltransferase n=1 Tax=unclassified Streptomyces TaxID=2593676 RepID=UPI0003674DAE|nr:MULTISPECIES: GNAT family N-acetyltransferase [unclassified Streptomyces]MYX26769.1 GNAT family N-acetyltransferase [Streptomyces sp. SID8381]